MPAIGAATICATAMTGDVLGREQELGSVYAFLDRPVEAPAALVLEGEAGIGKSTLWLAGVERARARAAFACSRRDRPRPSAVSLTWGWATCSRTSSRTSCLRSRRRGGVRSRSRSSARRPPTILSITARLAWRYATCCSCSASGSRFCLQSTTFSGSTRPRRARLRSRCEDSLRARFCVLLARRLVDGARAVRAGAGAGCGARRAAAGWAAQRRRAPSAAA